MEQFILEIFAPNMPEIFQTFDSRSKYEICELEYISPVLSNIAEIIRFPISSGTLWFKNFLCAFAFKCLVHKICWEDGKFVLMAFTKANASSVPKTNFSTGIR